MAAMQQSLRSSSDASTQSEVHVEEKTRQNSEKAAMARTTITQENVSKADNQVEAPLEKCKKVSKKVTGAVQKVVKSIMCQCALYIVHVVLLSMLVDAVRTKEENYLTKNLLDNIIDEPISEDYDHDQFTSIANFGDIDLFVSGVLLPALVVDKRMDESFKTPFEMAQTFDNLDWSSGLMIKQVRVAEGTCEANETGAVMRWFAESRGFAHASMQQHSYGPCHPEISDSGVNVGHLVDKQDFCYNWTHPDQPCRNMWRYFTAAELGADPAGQASASTDATYNVLPNDGFVAIIIPFFSETYLPDEEGSAPEEVNDYRQYAFNVSRGTSPPNFFCVRLSWNGRAVEQLCDPNDPETGRMTGRVLSRMLQFWQDMKSGHFVDFQTRILSFTLPVRTNHVSVKNRLMMMLQLTSTGGILPSFELLSRIDTIDYKHVFTVLNFNLVLVCVLIGCEAAELAEAAAATWVGQDLASRGVLAAYLTNVWNLMDWTGFVLFFLLYFQFTRLNASLLDTSCDNRAYMCTHMGFHDDWEQFTRTDSIKFILSLCVLLQWLKLIKFMNHIIPNMALATSVLSHGLWDLAMFTLFFVFTIAAFTQLFFIQLGPYLADYNDRASSFFSLARALFGDFDIKTIMDNSSTYINPLLLVLYLFSAIFILLSIFLTILGEHQEAVKRNVEQRKKTADENGKAEDENGTHYYDLTVLGALKSLVYSSCQEAVKRVQVGISRSEDLKQLREKRRESCKALFYVLQAPADDSMSKRPADESEEDPATKEQFTQLLKGERLAFTQLLEADQLAFKKLVKEELAAELAAKLKKELAAEVKKELAAEVKKELAALHEAVQLAAKGTEAVAPAKAAAQSCLVM